ncbi:MAG: hypothetical protein ABEJ74_08525 [Haloferacaceae archaeon]
MQRSELHSLRPMDPGGAGDDGAGGTVPATARERSATGPETRSGADLDRRVLTVAREHYERAVAEVPGELTAGQREAVAALAVGVAFGAVDPLRRALDADDPEAAVARRLAAALREPDF